MGLKRTLIETLPPWAKRLLAVPYDVYQTRRADRQFARTDLPSYDPDRDAPRHVVCVVVDALRTDHVDEETTPYLAGLDGCNAITPGAWTFPAVSSILTGLYPHEHGAMRQHDDPQAAEGLDLPPRMDADRETLTESLAGAEYDTYGGFGHDTPFVALSGRFGTHDLYHQVGASAEDVLDSYLEWVRGRDRTFAFVHLADPHIPVDPPAEYWEAHDVDDSIEDIRTWRYNQTVDCDETCQRYREHRRRLYRASIDYVDDQLAALHDQLTETVDDPLVIVTADHGEALWDHVAFDVEHFDGTGCVDHGGAPYEALARVPLLTNADWTFDGPVSLVDIVPTLQDLVGIEGPETSGYSLLDPIPEDRTAIVEGSLNGFEKKAVYRRDRKLIVSRGDDLRVGYELPDEMVIEVDDSEPWEELLATLPPWPDGETTRTEVADVVEDRLDRLGYR